MLLLLPSQLHWGKKTSFNSPEYVKKKNEPWELPSTNLFRKDLEIRILVMITAFEKNSAKNVQTLFWANAYGVEAP